MNMSTVLIQTISRSPIRWMPSQKNLVTYSLINRLVSAGGSPDPHSKEGGTTERLIWYLNLHRVTAAKEF
jgi:hypothetical protein